MTKYNLSFNQHIIEFYLQHDINRLLICLYFQLTITILESLINQIGKIIHNLLKQGFPYQK